MKGHKHTSTNSNAPTHTLTLTLTSALTPTPTCAHNHAGDLVLDCPEAPDLLAMFIARAVVDDVLPPAIVHRWVPNTARWMNCTIPVPFSHRTQGLSARALQV